MPLSAHILVSEANDVGLGQICVRGRIYARVGLVVLRQEHLRLVVDAEVGQLRLGRHGDFAANISHL